VETIQQGIRLDYVGGYQFGAAALEDLGYIKQGRSAKFKNAAVLDSDNWTGKDGIKDLNSFYKDKNLQDKLFDEYAEINYKKLKRKGVFKKDSSPEHVAGMLAASHLLGAGNASKDLSIKDGNKVPGNVYYELGRKAIKPALNLGSTKGEHRRIASQKRNEQKSMPEPKKVRTVPKEASQDSSMLEGLTNIFTGKTINIPKGGSLSKLAEQYGTGVPELLRINEDITDPNVVDAGQRVKVSRGILDYLSNIVPLSEGGTIDQYFEGQVVGRGDGMSDQIMFEVQGKKPDKALLSKDEYVLPADMVSILGNGSSNAGAEVLDQFVKDTRQKGFGTQRQQRQINPQKGLSALV
jgi:LysM repeat protein